MSKRLAVVVLLLTLCGAGAAFGADLYVGGGGSPDYPTIQDAVTAAAAGDTIHVAAGTYASVAVNKPVTLLGANAGIHPAVGTHPTATVGLRGPESVLPGLSPQADNITVDGFTFLNAGTRMIDTYANANNFHLTNCIVQSTANGPTTGVTQFGGGSHLNMVLEFNLFQDKGDSTLYFGGGPYNGLTIAYNRFNVEGDSIFWAATPLVDGAIEGNEFDGTIGGVAGAGFGEINAGQLGNVVIRGNWFHDQQYTAMQVGIIGGAIVDNTFERIYPYGSYGANAFELWGGQWGTAVSTDVTISGNTIRYNDIAGATFPTHGVRLRAPETGTGIDGSTIHISDNLVLSGGARSDAFAVRHQGNATTAVDADRNWWGTADGAVIAAMMFGNVAYDPWYADAEMITLASSKPVSNITQGTFHNTLAEAVTVAVAGDTIEIAAGTYALPAVVNLNKVGLTIQGVGSSETILQVSGTGYRLNVSAAGVTIRDLQIVKTDKTAGQDIIYVGANNATIESNIIRGQYVLGDPENPRAMVVTYGISNLTITGNTIYGLRQPAYMNGSLASPTTGTISNNHIYGTRGWVIDGANMTFTGNTWGTGAQANAFDIAILAATPAGYYTDIAAISAANNGAVIEDQRTSPSLLSIVYVDAAAPTGGTGTAAAPCQTIGQGIAKVAAGGTIYVAAGIYEAQLEIAKSLTLAGAGSETVIKSPAVLALSFTTTSYVNKPVVYVHDAANVVISDLTVDGFGRGNSNNRFMGIAYYNAGGQVADCVVKNIQDTPFSGAQHGVGIGAYNTDAAARSLVIADCDIYNFQKGGIVVSGAGLTVDISNNTVEGVGATAVTAMNGIQVYIGVTGQVRNNVVSGCYYTGASWGASAIIDYGTNVTLSGNTVTGSNFGIYCQTGADAATVFGNNIVGNDYGIVSGYQSPGQVDASQNWWGTPSGPTIVSVPGTLYAGDGDAVYDYSSPSALNVGAPLAKPATANTLYIEPTTESIYIKPTETCVMELKVANLQQQVTGLQAMLGFSSTYFRTGSGDVQVAPGGTIWDQVIFGVWNSGGDLDMSVGIFFDQANPGVGTQADDTTAKITLKPTGTQGYTRMVFRPDLDPDGAQIASTFLSGINGQPVWPIKVGSMNIVIDGTNPALDITSAKLAGQELIGTSTNAVLGQIDITVTAADALAGLAAAPVVTVTPNGSAAEAATYVGESPDGTFNYTWSVAAGTPNGVATITATVADKAGNASSDTATFNINKHEITGTVELEGLVPPAGGITRTVAFAATSGMSTKTWNVPVFFAAGQRLGTYRLTDVPADTTGLSAKTAWNLRRKVAVTYAADRAVVSFTGTGSMLLGGDLNGSNSINVLDYSLLRTSWYTTNPAADINGSGKVDLTDYSILKANWFKVGDPQ